MGEGLPDCWGFGMADRPTDSQSDVDVRLDREVGGVSETSNPDVPLLPWERGILRLPLLSDNVELAVGCTGLSTSCSAGSPTSCRKDLILGLLAKITAPWPLVSRSRRIFPEVIRCAHFDRISWTGLSCCRLGVNIAP